MTSAAASGWDRLADALASTLSELPPGAVLVLVDASDPDAGRFVQFVAGRTRLIEAGVTAGSPASGRPHASSVLRAAGWHAPGGDRRTWWRQADEGGEFDPVEAAEQIVTALRDALGFGHPGQLRYHGWVQGYATPLELPRLGLARHDAAPAAQPAILVARAADADRDARGRPVAPQARLDPDERERVVDYLGTAPVAVRGWGYDEDPFDAAAGEVVPLNIRTDGRWAWSESWAYFAARYGFAPEPALLAHIRAAGYRLPARLDAEILAAVAARLRDRTGGTP